jgi:hypothetical protein
MKSGGDASCAVTTGLRVGKRCPAEVDDSGWGPGVSGLVGCSCRAIIGIFVPVIVAQMEAPALPGRFRTGKMRA